jgi:hypothetical protein
MKGNRAAAAAMTVAGSVAIGVIVDRAETVAAIVAIAGQWQQRLRQRRT